jgi:hypothetical protein
MPFDTNLTERTRSGAIHTVLIDFAGNSKYKAETAKRQLVVKSTKYRRCCFVDASAWQRI